MWGGRFAKGIDDAFAQLNASFGFDWRLYAADIRGSIAYARALARAHLISESERDSLIDGLTTVHQEFDARTFAAKPSDEDIHTAVERRLGELIGAVAGKLHAGRSRNDQVATDTRIFVLDSIAAVSRMLRHVQRTLVNRAETNIAVIMPGYTHLQRAQPVLFSHWLMSYFWMLERDRERLAQCCERTAVLPLGSGALAGNALGIDREFLASELGFHAVTENSIDAVSDRDFISEFLFDAALVGVHLSRLGEDLALWSTSEYGFITMDDAYSTGSSLMPQKKNPDAMELARGKSARLIGNLTLILTLLKGLPTSYDKDLQEDKEPLFDAVDTLQLLLPVIAGVVQTMQVNATKMNDALDVSMLATDVADYLVRKGIPFRQAHNLAGQAVKLAETRQTTLQELSLGDYHSISLQFDSDIKDVFNYTHSVATHEIRGGTGPNAVRAQIDRAKSLLDRD